MSGDGFHQIRPKNTKSFSTHNLFRLKNVFLLLYFCYLSQKAYICIQKKADYIHEQETIHIKDRQHLGILRQSPVVDGEGLFRHTVSLPLV